MTTAVLLGALPALGESGTAIAAAATSTTEQSASEQAAASGEPVEVTAERTEYTTTTANPDGTFTLEQSATPQRSKAEDGAWQSVDATLERRADGTIGPKGAVVDLSFSAGGAGEGLIRLGKDGRSVTLGWPGQLPAPTLDGATATYADVLDGVDLQLTATAEGYREVLVVKTAEAAANPELEQIKLSVSGDGLEVVPGAGGGLRAVDDNGIAVLRGPAGQMWDSAGDDSAAPMTLQSVSLSASEASAEDSEGAEDTPESGPGEGDVSAVLPVAVQDGAVVVTPDLGVLRGQGAVYPVYIDPPVGLNASERTVLSSDGDTFWQFDGDKGVGRCSVSGPYYCGSNYVNRMYFEFAPTNLSGKYVLDATFRAYETWSFSCTPHWVDLERTNNISEGTDWPGPTDLDQMGDRYVSNGRGTLCDPEQPNAWVEFNDNPDEADENLASTVRKFADGKISRLTLMLRAKDESDPGAWKRFDDNAVLKVTYVPRPGVPTDVGLIPGNGTTQQCRTKAGDPLIVTRVDPIVQARVQTKVQPKSGEEKGSLQAEFWVERSSTDTASGTFSKVWEDYRPDSGWDPDGTLEKMRTTNRAEGGLYRYKARTQSHWSYSGSSGDMWSSYSSWCYFKIDTLAPGAPQITSVTPYTECADECAAHGGPGKAGTFAFTPNSADTAASVKSYRWWLSSSKPEAAKTVAALASGSLTVNNVAPTLGGTQTLFVEASDLDSDGRVRWGDPAEFIFKVELGTATVGRWHFDDAAPGSTVTTVVDTGEVGTRHAATLMDTAGAGWSGLGRRGADDYSLWLNDSTDTARQSGWAATSVPVVNTQESFTVSAWVYLTDTSANRVVLSAPGAHGSAFALYYSSSYNKWVFNRTATDVASNAVALRSLADTTAPPLRVWTHLAAVFDTHDDAVATNDTIQLYVNGRPQGSPVVLSSLSSAYTPWASTEGLQFGRSKSTDSTYGSYFRGRIDEVQVWQRKLDPAEVMEQSQLLESSVPATEMVASWDATTAAGTSIGEGTQYPPGAMALSGSGARLDTDDNNLVLDGTAGYASVTGPVVDETGSFTVTASAMLDNTKFASKPVGYRAQIVGQQAGGKESSWALWAQKVDDGVYLWWFSRTAVDTSGAVTATASVPSAEAAETGTWVQLTGVYDAADGRLHLYVGSEDQPPEDNADFTAVEQGTGELAAGRGTAGGTTGNYLPGALQEVRIWTGAMTADQVSSQVIGDPDGT